MSSQIICLSAAALASNIQLDEEEIGIGQSTVIVRNPVATKRQLEKMVVEEADDLGIVRKPNKLNLEILHLCSVLTSGEIQRYLTTSGNCRAQFLDVSPDTGHEARLLRHSDSHRRYQQALVEHVRSLDERCELSDALKAQYFYSTMIADAFASAISGRSPVLTSQDLEHFLPFVDCSTEGLLHSLGQLRWAYRRYCEISSKDLC